MIAYVSIYLAIGFSIAIAIAISMKEDLEDHLGFLVGMLLIWPFMLISLAIALLFVSLGRAIAGTANFIKRRISGNQDT